MNRLHKRFGGLYWRLTGAYFVVTLLAAVIIEVTITLPETIQEYQQAGDAVEFTQMLENQEAPLLAPFFTQSAPGVSTLQTALSHIDEHITAYLSAKQQKPLLFYLGVVDSQQHLLATDSPCAPASATITVQVRDCTPQDPKQPVKENFTAPIGAALGGDTQTTDWMAVTASGILIAAPIHMDGPGKSLIAGALVAVVSLRGNLSVTASPSGAPTLSISPIPSGFSQFLSIFWSHMQASGLYFILLASVVGTITGLLITRNVTRRLRRITQAAQAWSQGEFAVEVRDPTRDEIGQLGQDLNGMAEQLQALVITQHRMAVLEERQRWQRDLHDAVKQQLFAATMQIAAARACFANDTSKSYQHITEAEHLAGQAQRELTTLIYTVQPDGLAGKPFAKVLDDLCQQWSRQVGISLEMQVEGHRDPPPDVAVALYRVVQEALANITRHSAATRVTVRLHESEEMMTLAILDNGQGFDPTMDTAGFGLRSMRERMAALGGDLVIASSPAGTQITARIFRQQEAGNDA